jgi:cysteine synthase
MWSSRFFTGCIRTSPEAEKELMAKKDTTSKSTVSKVPQVVRYRELIGNTPLLDLTAMANPKIPGVRVLGKAEFMNPGFSHKDRMAQNIITKAMSTGRLPQGGTVVAASSGNTGASIAMLCSMMSLKAVIITSSKCSKEKMDSIRAYGAKLIISKPGQNYMEMEHELALANPEWFAFDQYNNPNNPEAHFLSTGPEIYQQTSGQVTHFVMAGSTGGTVSGVGKYLKQQNPDIQVVLADPVGSIFAHYHEHRELTEPKKFLVEGVGKENIPGAMDFNVIDDVIRVNDKDAFRMCRALAQKEGMLVGGSAGLNVHAAIEFANAATEPCTIVTLLCDSGIKYLSKVYNDEWLEQNKCNLTEENESDGTGSADIAATIKAETDEQLPVISIESQTKHSSVLGTTALHY